MTVKYVASLVLLLEWRSNRLFLVRSREVHEDKGSDHVVEGIDVYISREH